MHSLKTTRLATEAYLKQTARWPASGRVILAQYDADSVIVYQAYRPEIGHFAAKHGYFGGQFRLNRMTWIKTNFLWMMYRSGWGSAPGQEVTLAVRLRREAFNLILSQAVASSFDPAVHADEKTWKELGRQSEVRVQWDPDHSPTGQPLPRRAIQLGLRGATIERYSREWLLNVEDISQFVAEQASRRTAQEHLITPREDVLTVDDPVAAQRLGLGSPTN